MKALLLLICTLIILTGPQPGNSQTRNAAKARTRIIDLSYPFGPDTVYWPTAEAFHLDTDFEGVTDKGFYYSAYKYAAAEHGGTHIDAPVHFAKGRYSVDQIPLEQLIGPAVLIDVTKQCETNADYRVTVADIENWEKTHGRLPNNTILFLRTGFGLHYPDRKKYLGTDERGADAVAKLHFPGLHPDAARWLTTQRSIKAIGLDTASIDYGQSTLFESHQILFEKNIPAFENVANLDKLPVKGFSITALPMKIQGGSGGPLRIIATLSP